MQLQAVNRTDAEKIFGNFTNSEGATMTTGYAVCMTTVVASVDGNKAALPGTGNVRTFVGITDTDVADDAVGRFQSYGYNGSVYFYASANSLSIVTTDHCAGPAANSLGVGYTGVTTVLHPIVILESVGAIVHSAGGYVQGFIKAL